MPNRYRRLRRLRRENEASLFPACLQCGKLNSLGDEFCAHCNAALQSRVVVAGSTIDAELARMNYRDSLRWCADSNGILQRPRLARVARARGYRKFWIEQCAGRHWEDVLNGARRFHETD